MLYADTLQTATLVHILIYPKCVLPNLEETVL